MRIINIIIKLFIAIALIMQMQNVFAGTLTPADAEIVQAIQAKFAAHNVVYANKIAVTSHGGHVQLTGKVDTEAEASKLVELAESTPHVKEVDTHHFKVIKSKHPFKDAAITAKVKGIFIREKLFGDEEVPAMKINVVTKNAIVYLSGTAENKVQMKTAIKLAKSIKGVKRVKNKMQLEKLNS